MIFLLHNYSPQSHGERRENFLKISRALSQWFLSVHFPGAWFSMESGFFVMKRIVWALNFS